MSKTFANFIHDISLMSHLGIQLVLVPGIRAQIDARLKERNIAVHYVDGVRVTSPQTLDVIKESAGVVRVEIEAMLSMSMADTPMSGARLSVSSGNFVTARPFGVHNGIDFGFTGSIRRVDTLAIKHALKNQQLVLLSPLGYSVTGEIFNLRTEDIAMQVAVELQADKLIYMIDDYGVRDSEGYMVRQLSPSDCDNMVDDPTPDNDAIRIGMQNGARACRHGVRRTHLLNYRQDGALLSELFTRDGCGSMITMDHYDSVRSANLEDCVGILSLIQPLMDDGTLLQRNSNQIERDIQYFYVIERDGMIIACAALYPYDNAIAELACIAVHTEYTNTGRADYLLNELQKKARLKGIQQWFVLTTKTAHWFLERGFQLAALASLPGKKRDAVNRQRNAKVYIQSLDSIDHHH